MLTVIYAAAICHVDMPPLLLLLIFRHFADTPYARYYFYAIDAMSRCCCATPRGFFLRYCCCYATSRQSPRLIAGMLPPRCYIMSAADMFFRYADIAMRCLIDARF